MTIQYSSGPTVMMTLGRFKFGITTAAYQELERVTEFRWPAQERYMQGQALQYVGPGADTINLPGVIYPEFRGGLGQLDTLRGMGAEGVPFTMIDGMGRVMGEWVIERISDKGTVFAGKGVPRKQEFTINLRKFKDAMSGGLADSVLLAGVSFASGLAMPSSLTSLASLSVSASSQAGGFMSSLTGSLGRLNDYAGQIGAATMSVLTPVQSAIDTARDLKAAATQAKSLLGAVPTTLSGIRSAAGLLDGAATAVRNATLAGTRLQRTVLGMESQTTVPLEAIKQVRGALTGINGLAVAATKIHADASAFKKNLEGIGA